MHPLALAVWLNGKARNLAIRIRCGHPKHFLPDDDYWYVRYLAPHHRVLDVGCGTGMHSLRAGRHAFAVIGFDKAPTWPQGLTLNAEDPWPWEHATFDRVLCLDLLEHVHDRRHVLSEIRRVLAPEGQLLLAVPNSETSWKHRLARAGRSPFSDPDHKVEYDPPALRAELRSLFTIEARLPGVVDVGPLVGLIDVFGALCPPFYRLSIKVRHWLAERYPREDTAFNVVCRPV